ncbi:hypothetical protein SteCoe_5480 [Stentor coeruleus]|uniref:Uncharacterized protein n=1 Tax=Stentor coeruleus TaxID=5963 RepID=A0A1R2CSG1_9CILI|nr:hypothetical protein SteCoe_5480 [Stentor coeruleus]
MDPANVFFSTTETPYLIATIYPPTSPSFTNKNKVSGQIKKTDNPLPPVKDTKKSFGSINSGLLKTSTIFLNLTGIKDLSQSPKHMHIPKYKNDKEKYSVRHIGSIDIKHEKQFCLFNPPIAVKKDYFNKEIKKTVKGNFSIRRTSVGNNFNAFEFFKEKTRKISPDLFRGKGFLKETSDGENDRDYEYFNVLDKRSKISFVNFESLVQGDQKARKKEFRQSKLKKKIITKNQQNLGQKSFYKVDQGLQTDDDMTSFENNFILNQVSKFTMYGNEDDKSDCDRFFDEN